MKELYMDHIKSAKEFELAFEIENTIRIGYNQALREVTQRLLQLGKPMEMIIKVTKLKKREILAIAKEMDNP
jgi:hypothetical protein